MQNPRGFFASSPTAGLLAVVALVVGSVAVFLRKAFTIDDVLVLWIAERIREQPLDPYGFSANWGGSMAPMYANSWNPPLASYLIAGVRGVTGWGAEWQLHLVFLLPVACVGAATFLLARRLCTRPLEAAAIGLLTPVFLVSSTNVMADTLMLAFFSGSVWCWTEGIARQRAAWLLAGGVLAGLCFLSKYFGLALVPLLCAYALLRTRRLGAWVLCLLPPLIVAGAYELATQSQYGVGFLGDVAGYATSSRGASRLGADQRIAAGLVFAGGCLLPALSFAPLLWDRRVVVAGLLLLAIGVVAAPTSLMLLGFAAIAQPTPLYAFQTLALALGGASLFGLACCELSRRDADAWLLALWTLGTLCFAALVNWAVTGRSLLPLAPVVGILITRRLEARAAAGVEWRWPARAAALAPAVGLAFAVTWADQRWANDVRESARLIVTRFATPERTLYFDGHWGFQYYMEQAGARALDYERDDLAAGDLVVLPSNNYVVGRQLFTAAAQLVERIERPEPRWLRTMSPSLGAGFYSSLDGPLPFAFGPSEPDRYEVWQLTQPVHLRKRGDAP